QSDTVLLLYRHRAVELEARRRDRGPRVLAALIVVEHATDVGVLLHRAAYGRRIDRLDDRERTSGLQVVEQLVQLLHDGEEVAIGFLHLDRARASARDALMVDDAAAVDGST